MAISDTKTSESVVATAPEGGISAQLGEKSFPLVLRNGEIERFERHAGIGIFKMLDLLMHNEAKAHVCRDLVALGLVGGGQSDGAADLIVSDLRPHANMAIRGVARELLFATFVDPASDKKKEDRLGATTMTQSSQATKQTSD